MYNPEFPPEGQLEALARSFFQLSHHQTTVRREIVAGLTTFFTMAYIVAVNPAILKTAGMPAGASLTATILTAIFGTLLMGFYANRPFAIGPYMGENAFIAFTVVHVLGYTWQSALGAVFLAGILFILMTLFRLRSGWSKPFPPRSVTATPSASDCSLPSSD
jgi:AGZA family xanthine/uracil permease-like MFS transporter